MPRCQKQTHSLSVCILHLNVEMLRSRGPEMGVSPHRPVPGQGPDVSAARRQRVCGVLTTWRRFTACPCRLRGSVLVSAHSFRFAFDGLREARARVCNAVLYCTLFSHVRVPTWSAWLDTGVCERTLMQRMIHAGTLVFRAPNLLLDCRASACAKEVFVHRHR